jgi:Histidine kinase/GHKL domain
MNINKYHIYFWGLQFSFLLILDYLYLKERFIIGREFFMMFMQLSIFYSFLFALVKFKKGSVLAWLGSIGLFLLSFGFILFLNYLRGKLAAYYIPGAVMHATFGVLLNDTLGYYNTLALYATGYYFLMRSNTKQKELRQLSAAKSAQDLAAAQLATHNAQLRQEVLELEINFLRAQINPHFLYNTLNNFYSEAVTANQPNLAEGLHNLSKIMRYSLETTQGDQLVPLEMEVAQLKRVIAIHQLRFGGKAHISFKADGPLANAQMAPLVFVTLLENALKHGDANNADSPIALWLSVDAQRIYFTISNKKAAAPAIEDSHGIGLRNIEKRLQAVYGNNYQFGIEDKTYSYQVMLVINHADAANSNQPATKSTLTKINS